MFRASSTTRPRRFTSAGFTLVELLVVIGIIAVLVAILMPALNRSRQLAQRTVCATRLRTMVQADLAYANENEGRLIPGSRDFDTSEHTIWISHEGYDAFQRYGCAPRTMGCPALDTLPSNSVGGIGWVLGYDYLAGHPRMLANCGWKSPLVAADRGDLPVASDLNDWSPGDGWTVVGHSLSRTGGFVYDSGASATQFGAEGGNVAYLDGSVQWFLLGEMTTHVTYDAGGSNYLGAWSP